MSFKGKMTRILGRPALLLKYFRLHLNVQSDLVVLFMFSKGFQPEINTLKREVVLYEKPRD